jgi:hypothetical protein
MQVARLQTRLPAVLRGRRQGAGQCRPAARQAAPAGRRGARGPAHCQSHGRSVGCSVGATVFVCQQGCSGRASWRVWSWQGCPHPLHGHFTAISRPLHGGCAAQRSPYSQPSCPQAQIQVSSNAREDSPRSWADGGISWPAGFTAHTRGLHAHQLRLPGLRVILAFSYTRARAHPAAATASCGLQPYDRPPIRPRTHAPPVFTQPRATAILQEDHLNSPGPSRADPDPAFPS